MEQGLLVPINPKNTRRRQVACIKTSKIQKLNVKRYFNSTLKAFSGNILNTSGSKSRS